MSDPRLEQMARRLREELRLYNTLGRRQEPFRPLDDPVVRMYTCGITAYGDPHIGNMRAYIFSDVLKRTLELAGYELDDAMNVTDVGHLVSDADEGEDKLAVAAARERKTAWEIAEQYTELFFDYCEQLNIKPKRHVSPATAHIDDMIALIQRLEEKGVTYLTDDGVYFDTSRIDDYGKLTPADDRASLAAGIRVDMRDKRHPTDFALWKFSPADQQRDMEWPSPWGVGFPGWHIECSAIAMHFLGDRLDIHTGGVDHIATHHTNEIAQSETATGKPFARFWMHGAFLEVGEDQRMGKSEGNTITLRTLAAEGYPPLAYRYLVLTSHYRGPLAFTMRSLDAAATAFARLKERVREFAAAAGGCAPLGEEAQPHLDCFAEALADDLNTARAVGCAWNVARSADLDPATKLTLLLAFDEVLGLGLGAPDDAAPEVPPEVRALAEERHAERAARNFARADELRDEIAALGWAVTDTPDGYTLKPA